ncbi:hypothetical protein V6N13_029691 [Hibiscus sabdariffa]|uniref:Uncharacterized protein n=2 Tax=Hibiscus sabdariffa TaxID=183260 RepID=A0ABR2T9U7_9ROSI
MAPKGGGSSHVPPVFDCDCFECYTSYWIRWDSSPNREIIHQIIEAFDDHVTNGETKKPSKKNAQLKRKDGNGKMATRVTDVPIVEPPGQPDNKVPVLECSNKETPSFTDLTSIDNTQVKEEVVETTEVAGEFTVANTNDEVQTTGTAAATESNHKGLARKDTSVPEYCGSGGGP